MIEKTFNFMTFCSFEFAWTISTAPIAQLVRQLTIIPGSVASNPAPGTDGIRTQADSPSDEAIRKTEVPWVPEWNGNM